MNATLKEFQSNFNSNIDLIKNEYDKLILQINELEEKNNILEQENIKLTNTIEELNKEKKAKASSTIWESMNSKLAEKDIIIEQLKKDIEFYKRTGSKVNIADKWQSTVSKCNSSNFKEKKEQKADIINKNKEDNIETIKTVEVIEVKKDDNDKEKEVIIKKSKDKSKDKSEKKKKKKKVVEEEDLDDLEKELAGLN